MWGAWLGSDDALTRMQTGCIDAGPFAISGRSSFTGPTRVALGCEFQPYFYCRLAERPSERGHSGAHASRSKRWTFVDLHGMAVRPVPCAFMRHTHSALCQSTRWTLRRGSLRKLRCLDGPSKRERATLQRSGAEKGWSRRFEVKGGRQQAAGGRRQAESGRCSQVSGWMDAGELVCAALLQWPPTVHSFFFSESRQFLRRKPPRARLLHARVGRHAAKKPQAAAHRQPHQINGFAGSAKGAAAPFFIVSQLSAPSLWLASFQPSSPIHASRFPPTFPHTP